MCKYIKIKYFRFYFKNYFRFYENLFKNNYFKITKLYIKIKLYYYIMEYTNLDLLLNLKLNELPEPKTKVSVRDPNKLTKDENTILYKNGIKSK